MEDSLGDRVWVDLEPCKRFVENICTLFQTRTTTSAGTSSMSTGAVESGNTSGQLAKTSESGLSSGENSGGVKVGEKEGELSLAGVEVETRFSPSTRRSLKSHVLQLVSEQLSRHSAPTDSAYRNLLRFLTASAGYSELRLIAAQKMDGWIQNPRVCIVFFAWR